MTPDDFLRTGGAMEGGLGDSAFSGEEGGTVRIGERIGPVRILERIGVGGMGEVYLGIDDRLERQVAVKTLLPSLHLAAGARRRFIREARLLSRLDHPGICRLYDLVEVGDRPCLLLEYVEGQSLKERVGQLDRQEVIRIAVEIVDALVAAHRCGVVHRDLKPDNVMLTAAGEVKVLDFGIGQLVEGVSDDEPDSERRVGEESRYGVDEPTVDVRSPPTPTMDTLWPDHTGAAIVGTPRYMSPEQARGEPVTPMSDVFSFGVLLIELITGSSPYDADDLPSMLVQVAGAQVSPPSDVGKALGQLIGDLTHQDPTSRPTAAEAARRLHHIACEPRRKRRLTIVLASLGVVIGALVSAIVIGQRLGEGRYRCQGFEERLVSIWDAEIDERLGSAFAAAGRSPTWELARVRIDAYSQQWVETATTACEATWMRGEHSPELLDLTMACLDRRLDELGALVVVLGDDPGGVADRAVLAAHALSPLDVCVNSQLLTAEVPLPELQASRNEAHQIGLLLARVKALHGAGAYEEAASTVRSFESRVETLDHAPLTAEYQYLSGLLAERLGAVEDAVELQENAVLAAVAGRHDREAAKARVRMVWLRGVLMSDFEGAGREAAHAEAAIQRISGDLELEGALSNHMAIVASQSGHPAEAADRCFEALDLRRRAYGGTHPLVASTMQNCALMLQDLDRLEESVDLGEQAFAMRLETLGPDHPAVFASLESLSSLLDAMGRKDEAASFRIRAVELAERVLPPEHPNLGILKSNLASEALGQGDPEAAKELAREAVSILEASVGRASLETADAWFNLGLAALELDEWDTVVESAQVAFETYQERLGVDHHDSTAARSLLAGGYLGLERYQEAQRELEIALEAAVRTQAGEWRLILIRFRLGIALHYLGDVVRAQALFNQVKVGCEAHDDPWFEKVAFEAEEWLEKY